MIPRAWDGFVCERIRADDAVERAAHVSMPVEATDKVAAVLVAKGDRDVLPYISRIETDRAQPPFRLILAIVHQLDKAVGIGAIGGVWLWRWEFAGA